MCSLEPLLRQPPTGAPQSSSSGSSRAAYWRWGKRRRAIQPYSWCEIPNHPSTGSVPDQPPPGMASGPESRRSAFLRRQVRDTPTVAPPESPTAGESRYKTSTAPSPCRDVRGSNHSGEPGRRREDEVGRTLGRERGRATGGMEGDETSCPTVR